MKRVDDGGVPEENIDVSETERHLARARELLRDAQEHFRRREVEDPADSPPDGRRREP